MLNFLAETFLLALKNLRLHKLRSLLTALGIIIGVGAVIVMVAIGQGAKRAALEQLQQLGARNILVRSTPPPESTEASGRQQRTLVYGLTRADVDRLATLPDLGIIVPMRNTEQRIVRGDIVAPGASAIGTTPAIFEVIKLRLARGSLFDQLQYERAAAVCVIGHQVSRQLFPFEEPIGQTIRVGSSGGGTALLTVIGVLEPTGLRAGSDSAGIMQRDLDQDVYFPLTLARETFGDTVFKRQAGSMERKEIQISEVWLQAKEVSDVEALAKIAENVVGLSEDAQRKGGRFDVEVKAPIQILRAAEQTQRTFNFIMVTIASFALLVGGIGIMNIMLATVTERTREIGIRRALGAKRKHIILQFLIETTVLSVLGGLIGIGTGTGAAVALPWIVDHVTENAGRYPTDIATWSVVGSFLISGLIGIFFGLYPAVLAARMNPIEALRHE